MVCSTHGTEICAMVLCGSGMQCLRGPEPMPMRDILAEPMIASSCSSLRLAGSSLDLRFDRSLSFLDGPGRAYVGPLSSGSGGETASKRVFGGPRFESSRQVIPSFRRCRGPSRLILP